jgi:hypothetical protein
VVQANVVPSDLEDYLLFCPFYDSDGESDEPDRGIWFDEPSRQILDYTSAIAANACRDPPHYHVDPMYIISHA